MSLNDSQRHHLEELADLLAGIPDRLQDTTVEQRRQLADQAGQWVWNAMMNDAMMGPRWIPFRNQFSTVFLVYMSDNYALLFTEMVTWCREHAALVPVPVDVPADLNRPAEYAINGEIIFDPERWLTCGCPLFASIIRQGAVQADGPAGKSDKTVSTGSSDKVQEAGQPEYMPASWFRDEYGIPAERLRAARRAGNLAAKNIGKKKPKYLYSVKDAKALWPEDKVELS